MLAQIAEIVGFALFLAGVCTLVGAAALVSTALAVAVSGGFLLLAGVITVYVATMYERAAKARRVAEQAERRPT